MHGTAKSFGTRVLRNLIDPCSTPLRSQPSDGRDFAIAAKTVGLWPADNFNPAWSRGSSRQERSRGYRNDAVYLRTSRYVPPRSEAVRDAMPAPFDMLEHETDPGVRAVLGHWLLGYIHPYPDGNGRMARLLMSAMVASGGYPWTVIRVATSRRLTTSVSTRTLSHSRNLSRRGCDG